MNEELKAQIYSIRASEEMSAKEKIEAIISALVSAGIISS